MVKQIQPKIPKKKKKHCNTEKIQPTKQIKKIKKYNTISKNKEEERARR